jgi:hypothetical protein
MSNQAYGFKKDTRFAKHHDIADIYNQFLEKADQVEDSDDGEEVAAAEIMWGKEPLTVNQRWIKQTKGTYDFDVQVSSGRPRSRGTICVRYALVM